VSIVDSSPRKFGKVPAAAAFGIAATFDGVIGKVSQRKSGKGRENDTGRDACATRGR
jgi:hypothetical protein